MLKLLEIYLVFAKDPKRKRRIRAILAFLT